MCPNGTSKAVCLQGLIIIMVVVNRNRNVDKNACFKVKCLIVTFLTKHGQFSANSELSCWHILSDLECDFDSGGLCSWTQLAKGDNFDWTLNSLQTESTGTGPLADHTMGDANGMIFLLLLTIAKAIALS